MNRRPLVKYLIPCRDVRMGTLPSGAMDISIDGLQPQLRAASLAEFPVIHDLTLFVMLTDGTGPHVFQWEFDRDGSDSVTKTGKPTTIDLGNDPLAIRTGVVPMKNVVFHQPGVYIFRLWCDGQELDSVALRVYV
jgi:hypothetical protein